MWKIQLGVLSYYLNIQRGWGNNGKYHACYLVTVSSFELEGMCILSRNANHHNTMFSTC